MAKVCIICRKSKEKFNAEHIILATIGGSFEIDSVCKSCNENLSRKFNLPFLKNTLIGFYRKQLNLSRRDGNKERKIANPLKNAKLNGIDAEKYFIAYENGQPKAKRKPEVNVTKVDGGLQGRIIASKDDMESIKSSVFKKYGVNETQMTFTVEETKDPQFTFSAIVPKAPVFLECLKMAYEFTVTIIPEYFNDSWAQRISNFLDKDEDKEVIVARIDSINALLPLFEKELLELSKFPLHFHIISLKQFKTVGLICFVKVFDRIFPFHIADNNYLSDYDKEVAIFNDAITRQHHWFLSLKWKTINLSIDHDSAGEKKFEIEEALSKGNETISSFQDIIPVYKNNGELLTDNLANAIPYLFPNQKVIDFVSKRIFFDVTLQPDMLFIQYKPLNKLLPLVNFVAEYEIIL